MAAITKYHALGGLTKTNVFSQFWRLEVQNQGVDSAVLPLRPVGENPSLPLPSLWWFASTP